MISRSDGYLDESFPNIIEHGNATNCVANSASRRPVVSSPVGSGHINDGIYSVNVEEVGQQEQSDFMVVFHAF